MIFEGDMTLWLKNTHTSSYSFHLDIIYSYMYINQTRYDPVTCACTRFVLLCSTIIVEQSRTNRVYAHVTGSYLVWLKLNAIYKYFPLPWKCTEPFSYRIRVVLIPRSHRKLFYFFICFQTANIHPSNQIHFLLPVSGTF